MVVIFPLQLTTNFLGRVASFLGTTFADAGGFKLFNPLKTIVKPSVNAITDLTHHTGVLMLTAKRSEKTPYGSTSKMVKEEIEMLYPTISMSVVIALFDLGNPYSLDDEGGDENGVSVSSDEP